MSEETRLSVLLTSKHLVGLLAKASERQETFNLWLTESANQNNFDWSNLQVALKVLEKLSKKQPIETSQMQVPVVTNPPQDDEREEGEIMEGDEETTPGGDAP